MIPILFSLLRRSRTEKSWLIATMDIACVCALAPFVLQLYVDHAVSVSMQTAMFYLAGFLILIVIVGLHHQKLRRFDRDVFAHILALALGIIAISLAGLSFASEALPASFAVTFGLSAMLVLSLYRVITAELINWLQSKWQAVPEDFLSRDHTDKNSDALTDTYAGKTIMVTGAGGSIGSEICREVLSLKPKRLILFDISEFNLYKVERDLVADALGETEIVPTLGDVTNSASLAKVFLANSIDVILHAAAYKHVPLVEQNSVMGVRNNVLGTQMLAKMAIAQRVGIFVNVSTDKAVRPTSMMGASKRVAELIIQNFAAQKIDTRFSIVRFGNVLGSSGSVIPAFQKQIKNGGPVTVTDQNITRFFMTTGEAAELVLTAGSITEGGEVFLLDMGNPVRIFDLAKSMIKSSGNRIRSAAQPDGDIEINITGLRPGEKVFEELLIDATAEPTSHPKIFKAQEPSLSEIETERMVRGLKSAISDQDEARLRRCVFSWISEETRFVESQLLREAS